MTPITVAAFAIGVLVAAQGVLGLLLPDVFFGLIREIQRPPVIYLAAVVRVMFGVVLVLAAARSRAPMLLRALGILIVIGGLLTPIIGVQFAQVILGWWSESPTVIRAWAGFALVLGTLIVYAAAPQRAS